MNALSLSHLTYCDGTTTIRIFIRWIILLSRVPPTYRRATSRQAGAAKNGMNTIAYRAHRIERLLDPQPARAAKSAPSPGSADPSLCPSDPVSFAAALLLVGAIAAAASCLPIWRTLRINPAAILRDE